MARLLDHRKSPRESIGCAAFGVHGRETGAVVVVRVGDTSHDVQGIGLVVGVGVGDDYYVLEEEVCPDRLVRCVVVVPAKGIYEADNHVVASTVNS